MDVDPTIDSTSPDEPTHQAEKMHEESRHQDTPEGREQTQEVDSLLVSDANQLSEPTEPPVIVEATPSSDVARTSEGQTSEEAPPCLTEETRPAKKGDVQPVAMGEDIKPMATEENIEAATDGNIESAVMAEVKQATKKEEGLQTVAKVAVE
jgi:hypothetical protein